MFDGTGGKGGNFTAYLNNSITLQDSGTQVTFQNYQNYVISTNTSPVFQVNAGTLTFSGTGDGSSFNVKNATNLTLAAQSSSATLKHGIESLLKHYVPEVSEVRAA